MAIDLRRTGLLAALVLGAAALAAQTPPQPPAQSQPPEITTGLIVGRAIDIAAVTDVEQGEWYNPDFLAQLVPAGTKITLGEGEKKVQSLRIR